MTARHECKWRRDVAKLTEQLRGRDQQLSEKDETIAVLTARLHDVEHELAVLRKNTIGPKRERMPTPDDDARKRNGEKPTRGGHTGPDERKKNAAALAALPMCVIPHSIPDDERRCPHCGEDVRPIGDGDVSFEIEWIPGRLVRRKHVVETGRCPCKQHYARGPAPERVEEGRMFGPALIAKLVVDKCGDAIPIYRVERRMRRAGIPLSRSTMNDMLLRAADLLEPLYDIALGELRLDPHLQADETSFRTQGRKERVFVWTFLSSLYTLYIFSPSRSGDTPKDLLEGTTGTLVCDGYSGYNVVSDVDGRTRGGCWCHVRRKLFEALPTAPEGRAALDIIIDLFLIERDAAEREILGTPTHLALRRQQSAAVLNRLLLWMKGTRPLYEPSSAMGKAIGYIVNQWPRLTEFVDHAHIAIHNNASEAALRIVAMARKSSLFFGNDQAGRRLVVLYSLVATCEKNGVNPEVYIRDVLMRMPNWPKSRLAELLPQRWKAALGTAVVAEPNTDAPMAVAAPDVGASVAPDLNARTGRADDCGEPAAGGAGRDDATVKVAPTQTTPPATTPSPLVPPLDTTPFAQRTAPESLSVDGEPAAAAATSPAVRRLTHRRPSMRPSRAVRAPASRAPPTSPRRSSRR